MLWLSKQVFGDTGPQGSFQYTIIKQGMNDATKYPIQISVVENKIPKILIFTYRFDLLGPDQQKEREPNYFENIIKTIRMYSKAWKQNNTNEQVYVWFMDDEQCLKAIRRVEPKLIDYFLKEKDGSQKADICRGAALYLTGGYYFDIDMLAISPVQLSGDVTLSVAASGLSGFFNSYLIATPRNPVIRDYLQILFEFYQLQKQRRTHKIHPTDRRIEEFYARMPPAREAIHAMLYQGLVGTWALKGAVRYHQSQNVSIHILQETRMESKTLQKRRYPNLQFQHGVGLALCNFVVEDREARRAYFFSRFVGSKFTCEHPDETKRFGTPLPWETRKQIIESLGIQLLKITS